MGGAEGEGPGAREGSRALSVGLGRGTGEERVHSTVFPIPQCSSQRHESIGAGGSGPRPAAFPSVWVAHAPSVALLPRTTPTPSPRRLLQHPVDQGCGASWDFHQVRSPLRPRPSTPADDSFHPAQPSFPSRSSPLPARPHLLYAATPSSTDRTSQPPATRRAQNGSAFGPCVPTLVPRLEALG